MIQVVELESRNSTRGLTPFTGAFMWIPSLKCCSDRPSTWEICSCLHVIYLSLSLPQCWLLVHNTSSTYKSAFFTSNMCVCVISCSIYVYHIYLCSPLLSKLCLCTNLFKHIENDMHIMKHIGWGGSIIMLEWDLTDKWAKEYLSNQGGGAPL